MAEIEFRDTVTTDMIRAMMGSGMKSFYNRDAIGRVTESYEAPLSVEIGGPCIKTIYKYVGGAAGSNRRVLAWEEEVVAWPGYELAAPGSGNDIDLVP